LPGGCAVAAHSQGEWKRFVEGDTSLPRGRSPHLKGGESLEGEHASAGRGCFERGTLNANGKAN